LVRKPIFFSEILPLKRRFLEVRSVFEEGDIETDKGFVGGRVKTFIAFLCG
jgi:hypothetical protein